MLLSVGINIISEGIIFLTYIVICSSLIKSRWSKKAAVCVVGAVLAVVILLQAVLFMTGHEETLLLTMLPVTAYLPFSVSLYVITSYGLAQTASVWTFGVLAVYILKAFKKMMGWYIFQNLAFPYNDLWVMLLLLAAAGLLVFVSFRFLRKPFYSCMEKKRAGLLLIFFPIFGCLLLLSYFMNSPLNYTVMVLIVLTTLSVFLVAIRAVSSQASMERMKQAEEKLKDQMDRQFREYEDVRRKVEAGRINRHDMRHHLLVMEELAKQSDMEGIRRYIEGLQDRLLDTEHEAYCANATIDAVLAPYIRQAEDEGCAVTAQINLPETIPFDEMDVCMVLANALENAVHACCMLSKEQDRYIQMKVELRDAHKLIISIKNPVELLPVFDEDGIPVSTGSQEHGIGLKSIRAITDKYNGFFRCKCDEMVFGFYAALFGVQHTEAVPVVKRIRPWKKLVSAFGVSAIAVALFAGFQSVPALAFTGIYRDTLRVYGSSFQVSWGGISLKADYPVVEQTGVSTEDTPSESGDTQELPSETVDKPPSETVDKQQPSSGTWGIYLPPLVVGDTQVPSGMEGTQTLPSGNEGTQTPPSGTGGTQIPPAESGGTDLTEGVDEMNRRIEEFWKEATERFIWYASRKYEGYVSSEITWQTLRDDEALLVIKGVNAINAGGSGEFSRCFILDKKSGNMLELKDLFLEGSDYVEVISAEVLKQMTKQQQNGEGRYFIPGSIFDEKDWFRTIAEDQNFYINDQNRLVIVFDEYEVAPGFMGMPEFVIDTGVLQKILKRPSVIS